MILTRENKNDISEWYRTALAEGASALIDKDSDWTSFDVVAKLRNLTKIKKVGHAGTLDPLATGLLILCFGKATKTISGYQDLEKEYHAVIKLGAVTKTDDSEGEEENILPTDNITDTEIVEAINSFKGEIMQVPPIYSAKKVKGKRLYKLARKGIETEIEPVKVTIYGISDIDIRMPYAEFTVRCSKGTYIRSLARDIGTSLGCGAYLHGLRRTAIGAYNVKNALKIQEFVETFDTVEV